MLTVGVMILEHPTSGRSFEIVPAGQSKIHQDWTIVCCHNEARDYLDSFPPNQRPIATILHSWLFYALVATIPHAFTLP